MLKGAAQWSLHSESFTRASRTQGSHAKFTSEVDHMWLQGAHQKYRIPHILNTRLKTSRLFFLLFCSCWGSSLKKVEDIEAILSGWRRHGTARRARSLRHGTARFEWARFDSARHGTFWMGTFWLGTRRHVMNWHGPFQWKILADFTRVLLAYLEALNSILGNSRNMIECL